MDEFNQNTMPETLAENPVDIPTEAPDNIVYEDAVLPAEEKKNTVFGIVSLICGIASIVFACCCPIIAFPCAIAAVIMSIIERKKLGEMTVFSKIGLGLGIAGLIFGIVCSIFNPLTISILQTLLYGTVRSTAPTPLY